MHTREEAEEREDKVEVDAECFTVSCPLQGIGKIISFVRTITSLLEKLLRWFPSANSKVVVSSVPARDAVL